MLTCPNCQTRIQENSSSCPSPNCLLSLQAVNSVIGPVPLLKNGLNDSGGLLNQKQWKSINAAVERFNKNMEPTRINIIIQNFDLRFNLATQLFWLFNASALSSNESRLGENHDILLGLDPQNGRVGLMIGYGLEPFVPKNALDEILKQAHPQLEAAQHPEAILQIIKQLTILIRNCSAVAKEALGL